VFEIAASMIPSALAEIAEFMKLIISDSLEVAEPPHCGVGRPRSAAASSYPYLVGVKNSFVSAWLTNQNFHPGVFGKLPPVAATPDDVVDDADVADELALLELDEVQAAISAEAAAVALNSPAPSIRRRRVGPSFMFRVSIASSTTGSTFFFI
jgi:hypothetical protein